MINTDTKLISKKKRIIQAKFKKSDRKLKDTDYKEVGKLFISMLSSNSIKDRAIKINGINSIITKSK